MLPEELLRIVEEVSPKGERYRPHKHMALLAAIVYLDTRDWRTPRIDFDGNFRRIFSDIFARYACDRDRDRPYNPFFHLRTSGIWELVPTKGYQDRLSALDTIGGPGKLAEAVDHAELSEGAFDLLMVSQTRRTVVGRLSALLEEYAGSEGLSPRASQSSRFPHEAGAIAAVRYGLDDRAIGQCIPNYFLYDQATNGYLECDLVVATRSGLWVVELKHWSGDIEVRPHNWRQNDSFRNDPHKTNRYKCQVLRGVLESKFRTQRIPWITSVVVLTNDTATVIGGHTRSVPVSTRNLTFHTVSRFLDFLNYRKNTAAGAVSDAEIEQYIGFLRTQAGDVPSQPRETFAGYETVECITSKPAYRELLVRPTDGRHRQLLRLRVFAEDPQASPSQRQVDRQRALRTLETIAAVGSNCPNLHYVFRVPDDTDLIVEAGEWSEQGTLADEIADNPEGLDIERALKIFEGILRGLGAVHEHGIYHRALKPTNVLLSGDVPRLTDFELSLHLDAEQTVLPDHSALKRDPYTPPELFSAQEDESSDLFSAGVILCEMLLGRPPFAAAADLQRTGGQLPDNQLDALRAAGCPQNALDVIARLVRTDVAGRLNSPEAIFSSLSSEPPAPPAGIQPGDEDAAYKILEKIGDGASAEVFRADRMNYGEVALKVFRSGTPKDRVFEEEKKSRLVDSPYVVHCNHACMWKGNRFCIELNYIPGKPLREAIDAGAVPGSDQFRRVARCLLGAVEALHTPPSTDGGAEQPPPILHADIKPENVLVKEDGTAVLIDLGGARSSGIGPYAGTAGYVAPDLCNGADLDYTVDGDLFALGTTLFEYLFGRRPYGDVPTVGAEIVNLAGLRDNVDEALIGFLARAVATRRTERFQSAQEMTEAFEAACRQADGQSDQDHPTPEVAADEGQSDEPVTFTEECGGNPFVAYLNSLQNVDANNRNALAESQAMSAHFGHIHVPLPITERLADQLTGPTRRHVVLTGHAGDGKTTIALSLFKRFCGIATLAPLTTGLEGREVVEADGHRIVLIKDMSELPADDRREIIADACGQGDTRYMIISNTGTLLEALRSFAVDAGRSPAEQESDILRILEKRDGGELKLNGAVFALVNLALDNMIPTAIAVLEKIVDAERWKPCFECDSREGCPVFRNAQLIRDNWEIVSDRIRLLYQRMREYGQRLTIRQLSAHLAYMITANLDFARIRALAAHATAPPMRRYLFHNRFFGDDGERDWAEAGQLAPVRLCREIRFGSRPFVKIDRGLWHSNGRKTAQGYLPEAVRPFVGALYAQTGPTTSLIRRQVRRLLFFFGRLGKDTEGFLGVFTRSPMLLQYRKWLCNQETTWSGMTRDKIRRNVLRVLQEHFTGSRLPEGTRPPRVYITLSRPGHSIRQSAQVVLASFDAGEFDVVTRKVPSLIGSQRHRLLLTHKPSDSELELDLPLLDYVMLRHGGEVGRKLNANFVDRLDRFKARLLDRQAGSGTDAQRASSHKVMLIRLRTDSEFVQQQVHVDEDNGVEVFYA